MSTTCVKERQATVRKDRYRDPERNEYIQYTIKYEDGSGEFLRVPVKDVKGIV